MEFVPPEKKFPSMVQFMKMTGVYFLIALAAHFFRIDSLSASGVFLNNLMASDLFVLSIHPEYSLSFMFLFFICTEWYGRSSEYGIQFTGSIRKSIIRYTWYLFVLFFTGMYMQSHENPFIYFNF